VLFARLIGNRADTAVIVAPRRPGFPDDRFIDGLDAAHGPMPARILRLGGGGTVAQQRRGEAGDKEQSRHVSRSM